MRSLACKTSLFSLIQYGFEISNLILKMMCPDVQALAFSDRVSMFDTVHTRK